MNKISISKWPKSLTLATAIVFSYLLFTSYSASAQTDTQPAGGTGTNTNPTPPTEKPPELRGSPENQGQPPATATPAALPSTGSTTLMPSKTSGAPPIPVNTPTVPGVANGPKGSEQSFHAVTPPNFPESLQGAKPINPLRPPINQIPTQVGPGGVAPGPPVPKATRGRKQMTLTLPTNDPDLYDGHRLLPKREIPKVFRQTIEVTAPQKPFTLHGAVEFSLDNYPRILQEQAQIRAMRDQVAYQKAKEYTPYSSFEFQEVFASRNKITQIIWGSEVFPGNPGPGNNNVNMHPHFFSGSGVVLDWAPIDFGLHKANISLQKANLNLSRAQYGMTRLDVAVNAADSFLDTVIAHEQVRAAEANVARFQEFSKAVHAEVDADLKPGADASLADAQLANSKNDLIRSRLEFELAMASLANSLGLGGNRIDVNPGDIAVVSEPADVQRNTPIFENHPIAVLGKASILTAAAERHTWERSYFPRFRFLGGFNLRGSGIGTTSQLKHQSLGGDGVFPVIPNYNLGMIIDFPFMDWWKIHYQRKRLTNEIAARQHSYDMIIQNLRTQDVQARARVSAAVALAANMPVQVEAALSASRQAQARYEVGLGTVAQVAQANQLLAESRVKEAVAKVGVWKALLAVAAVHGDIKPFLDEAARLNKGGVQ